jgi:hypothetical protein
MMKPEIEIFSQQGFPSAEVQSVIVAVESLYNDQLKPYSRIILKRLGEQAHCAVKGSLPIMDAGRLREVCGSCAWLCVQPENGAEWSVLLSYRPADFVDVYSPQDIYPAELWRAAEQYFENLDDAHMTLPGGRYSCAQTLQARGLPFLLGRSLGEVCHIVQLGISQKKLLGYLQGAVVPYGRSQSRLKDRCAERQRPCISEGEGFRSCGSANLADWKDMRSFVRESMSRLTPGADSVPLSNVKRLFRTRFNKELSETALGHAKLSELFQDQRLHDLCSVRLQSHNYVLMPVAQAWPRKLHIADSFQQQQSTAAQTPWDMAGSGERSTLRDRGRKIVPLSLDDALPSPPSGLPPCITPAAEVPPPPSGLAADRQHGRSAELVLQTPSPSCTWQSRCLRRDFLKGDAGNGDKLTLAEVVPGQPVLTPCTLSSLGFKVSNTFIQASLPPPTPLRGSSRRSRSVPRSVY